MRRVTSAQRRSSSRGVGVLGVMVGRGGANTPGPQGLGSEAPALSGLVLSRWPDLSSRLRDGARVCGASGSPLGLHAR